MLGMDSLIRIIAMARPEYPRMYLAQPKNSLQFFRSVLCSDAWMDGWKCLMPDELRNGLLLTVVICSEKMVMIVHKGK